jgi:drug/metabolite transporter (DMT)-like permease
MGPAFGEVPGALAWIGTAIGVVGYFSVTLADALVIEAMRTLSAAEVVADTNAYIVLATAMSLVVFRQRTRWQQRAVAAGVVFAGLACIGVGRGSVKADAALGPGQVSCCPWSALRQSRGATP